MKLYTSPGACSLADHIALHWTGTPFEAQVMSRDQRRQPDFLALNPAGAVPVLQVGDWVLTQNAAILNYVADKFPEAKLGGDGSPESRAEVNRWLAFLNSDMHPAFHPLFGANAALGSEAEAKSKELAKQKLRGLFERADAQLAGKDWLTGSRSIADPYLFVVTQWAKKLGIDLSGLDNLAAFDARMAADAGVQAALKAEGLA
ncbi:MAG: glutathione S-transferase family protein [Lysobacteraceae bacterium]|nr:MAG: glutathione S-transferase family protein [Xanthomonadaceae bacterium]